MKSEQSIAIYEQYWQHARHVENELLSFTSFYAVIVAASFIYFEPNFKIPYIILIILSTFGFFINYTLRIPFIKFTFKAELIAINEFGLKNEYRRFFNNENKLFKDKYIGVYDIFALFYIGAITLAFYSLYSEICLSTILFMAFILIHLYNKRSLNKIREDILSFAKI